MAANLPKKVHVGVAAVNTSAGPLAVEFEDLKIMKK